MDIKTGVSLLINYEWRERVWYEGVFNKENTYKCSHNINITTDHPCNEDPIDPDKNLGCQYDEPAAPPPPMCGNPINAATGNKLQPESDFTAASQTQIGLRRYYNSQDTTASGFGKNWHSTWHRGLIIKDSNTVSVTRADERKDKFTLNGSTWTAAADVTSTLGGSAQSGWILRTANDTQEGYSSDGRLMSLTNREGLVTTLAYDGNKRLTSVTGPFGHALKFENTASGNVSKMTTPDGQAYSYAYDTNNNLTSVTYPDATSRKYAYENASFPNAMTGIIDENGTRFATYAYDDKGRATSTQHADGVDLTTVTYNADGSSSVRDPLGNVHGYNFKTQFGLVKPTAITGVPVQTSGGKSFAYDSNGFVNSRTDFNGNITAYTHNSRGLETSRIKGSGSAVASTTQTDWHPTFRLPASITEPNRATSFNYDSKGNLTTKTTSAGSLSRAWNYTYNGQGQVLTSTGPNSDTTQFAYDASGNLTTTTIALGHVTRTSHDANGRPLTITDSNGLVTTLTYDARGRIKTRNAGGETTAMTYDGVGNMTQMTRPDGSFLTYTYDAAHRLTGIQDSLGNRVTYTLDVAGNRTKEETQGPKGSRMHSYTYDNVNRLLKEIGAQGQTTSYTYDDNSNQTKVTDPLGYATGKAYDALNRLIQTIDQNSGTTAYAYDANDHLISVTDPRHLTTAYTWDGLGNQTAVTSPDTGTTTRTYDAAGNLTSSTDARGKTTTYSYDLLNRKTKETFADGQTTIWQYDQGTNGIGHLTQMTDATGSIAWTYDSHGRVLTRQQKTDAVTLTTTYGYDASGRLASLAYPSGKTLTFGYDAAGQVNGISANGVALVSQVTYQPFGSASTWTQGNGATYSRTLDQDGRIVGIDFGSASPTSIDLTHDAAGRIVAMSETGQSLKDFTYDPLGQLTSYRTGTDATTLAYDANGNRLQTTASAGATNYSYSPTSNRLTEISGQIPDTNNLAASTYAYDARGRLTQATLGSSTTAYGINGLGQRVSKSGTGGSIVFAYDGAGHLLGEYTASGQAIQETVWLGDTPVAVMASGGTYYVNANHLNAPRIITNSNGQVVWSWDPVAFGDTQPIGAFTYNLRFPGQYYDAETGFHYNMARDYNPSVGRYVQSDPIGLRGGLNTYGYVRGNPVSSSDSHGLVELSLLCPPTFWNQSSWYMDLIDDPDYYDVSGHGFNNDSNLVGDQSCDKKNVYLVEDLANKISKDPKWNRKPIFLRICFTADHDFAQRLANLLGVDVKAPHGITFAGEIAEGGFETFHPFYQKTDHKKNYEASHFGVVPQR
ncbi:hypothetical protein CCP4SC76_7230003 [Gammaproteobacteria bacterium]